MTELNYKASNIAKAELEFNSNFFETLEGLGQGAPSFTALLFVLRAGGLSEQEADSLLDDEGITASIQKAIEALGRAGFLAKMQAEALKSQSKVAPQTSPSTGSETKA